MSKGYLPVRLQFTLEWLYDLITVKILTIFGIAPSTLALLKCPQEQQGGGGPPGSMIN